jgi:tetraacyldisaccharide 4'-kinase
MNSIEKYLYRLATDKEKGLFASIIKLFLFILSLCYGFLVRALSSCKLLLARRLNCKVISVGNITFGGTGKTTLVEYIARALQEKGHRVAVLSRGYKRRGPSAPALQRSSSEMGDEPYMLSRKLGDIPVIVDADRARSARRAVKDYSADTVLLDDGFQQWGIKKDLEIVAVDAVNPFGNRRLLPRGILREPLSSLKRADIIVLTKVNLGHGFDALKREISRINPAAAVFESSHQALGFSRLTSLRQEAGITEFKNRRAALFCGIGDPESFKSLMLNLGVKAELFFAFADHHHYSRADLSGISGACEEKNINIVVTTEKDAARLDEEVLSCLKREVWVLQIALQMENEREFHDRLFKLYSL